MMACHPYHTTKILIVSDTLPDHRVVRLMKIIEHLITLSLSRILGGFQACLQTLGIRDTLVLESMKIPSTENIFGMIGILGLE